MQTQYIIVSRTVEKLKKKRINGMDSRKVQHCLQHSVTLNVHALDVPIADARSAQQSIEATTLKKNSNHAQQHN